VIKRSGSPDSKDQDMGAHGWRPRDAPWRVRDGGKEEEEHFSNEHNPMMQIRPVDIL
jgi:hypothetical protein